MKRIIAILLLVCMLAGCGNLRPTPTDSDTLPHLETETSTVPQEDLLRGMVPMGNNSPLYTVDSEIVRGLDEISKLLTYKNYLAILSITLPDDCCGCGMDSGPFPSRIVLIDQQTGKLHASLKYEAAGHNTLQVAGDYLVINSCDQGTMQFLDEDLHTVAEYQIPPSWTLNHTDASGQYAYSIPDSDPAAVYLSKTDLKTGKETRLLEGMLNLTVNGLHDQGAALGYLDSQDDRFHNIYLDFRDNSITEIPFPGNYSYADCLGGLWIANSRTVQNMYLVGREEDPYVLRTPNAYYRLIEGPAPLYTMDFGNSEIQTMRLYREDGSFYAKCDSEITVGFTSDPVWSQQRNGYFFTARTSMDGENTLLFWDITQPGNEDSLDMRRLSTFDWEAGEGGAVSQELYDYAARLSEEFHIDVRIADKCSTEFNHYTALPVNDYFVIDGALRDLDTVLHAFPKGFVQQLQYGDLEKTQIHLMGQLTATDIPADANGFTDFAGFVDHSTGRHIMVLNVTLSDLQKTMFHEFSHIIDSRLDFRSQYRDTLYSELRWGVLNPAEFSYCFDVYQVPEYYYYDGYDDCFLDVYSRTFPTEDRARIFENACTNNTWAFDPQTRGTIRRKLAYYCAGIRDGFDTTGWEEETIWEKPLKGYRFDPADLPAMDQEVANRAVG